MQSKQPNAHRRSDGHLAVRYLHLATENGGFYLKPSLFGSCHFDWNRGMRVLQTPNPSVALSSVFL